VRHTNFLDLYRYMEEAKNILKLGGGDDIPRLHAE
jgi:hypothetical protein